MAEQHDDPGSDLMRYQAVRNWIENTPTTGLRPASDRAQRLELMRQFCAYLACDPDTLVATARGNPEIKNGYLKQLVSWAASLPLSDRARHDAENTVRGFFMRNGFRVVARPYRDVYVRDLK